MWYQGWGRMEWGYLPRPLFHSQQENPIPGSCSLHLFTLALSKAIKLAGIVQFMQSLVLGWNLVGLLSFTSYILTSLSEVDQWVAICQQCECVWGSPPVLAGNILSVWGQQTVIQLLILAAASFNWPAWLCQQSIKEGHVMCSFVLSFVCSFVRLLP